MLFSFSKAQPLLKGKPGVSKQYAILSARYADRSYKFAKLSYLVSEPKLADLSLDSARFFIDQAMLAMDSAIALANDSDLIALNLADISLQYSNEALMFIDKSINSNGDLRVEYSKDAVMQSANAVADAYHASMYFRGELKKKEAAPVKKDSIVNKVISKLDVDQTLFTMLIKDLEQKIISNKAEIQKLNAELSKTKDAAKSSKIKGNVKKLEKDNVQLEAKSSETKTKLESINSQIAERDKSGIAPVEPSLAKGLHFETLDEWNKHLILDAELPANLIYQVQVGVYKKKVLYEIFKGLTPVYGKTTPQGISYAIGIFKKVSDARQAKEYITSIGLRNAFIVVYYNNKRITTAEAAKLEKKE